MRRKILIIVTMLLFGVCPVQAVDITFSTSGTIIDGDVYDTVYVENDFTVVDMLGGQVGNVFTSDISTFNMSGGQVTENIMIGISGTMNVSNGVIDVLNFAFQDDSYTLILGGNITASYMKVYNDCTIDIKGALLQVNNFYLSEFDIATINIYGYDFDYTGGVISGYLIDDNPFSISGVSESEYLGFNLVPEPTSLLILGMGSLLLRRRS